MKTETMTPSWVVENFLPDFIARIKNWEDGCDSNSDNGFVLDCSYSGFIDNYFPEALLGLLKAQREVCADNAKIQRVVVDHNGTNNEFGYIVDRESIINSPIPEPKNRK